MLNGFTIIDKEHIDIEVYHLRNPPYGYQTHDNYKRYRIIVYHR